MSAILKLTHGVKEVEAKGSLYDLMKSHQSFFPYPLFAARVNNRYTNLIRSVRDGDVIEFLDIRNQEANMMMQHGLSLMLIEAMKEVLGMHVEIANSLNKGLFVTVQGQVSDEDVKAVEAKMHEYAEKDYIISRIWFNRDEALFVEKGAGRVSGIELIEGNPELKRLEYYQFKDLKCAFNGSMVYSTGMVSNFELRRYKNGMLLRFPHPSNPNVIPEYEDQKLLYTIFAEETRFGKMMGVHYVCDLNAMIMEEEEQELIRCSEAYHEKKIAEIADQIKKDKKRIILIAGPSSSGKTTFAKRLCIQLKVNGLNPLYMGTDDYFKNRDETPLDANGEKDYECLGAVDIPLFNKQLNDLLDGKTVDMPRFDFIKGEKVYGEHLVNIDDSQPIVIEGIHALNHDLTPYIDDNKKFKIYISPLTQINIDAYNRISTTDSRMLRRMVRDHQKRGNSAVDTIRNWPKVRAGEEVNIFPYSVEADAYFNSNHLYEIAVLKKYAKPLLEEIGEDVPEYAEAQRMLNFLNYFIEIEDDSQILSNSILREFIGGSHI